MQTLHTQSAGGNYTKSQDFHVQTPLTRRALFCRRTHLMNKTISSWRVHNKINTTWTDPDTRAPVLIGQHRHIKYIMHIAFTTYTGSTSTTTYSKSQQVGTSMCPHSDRKAFIFMSLAHSFSVDSNSRSFKIMMQQMIGCLQVCAQRRTAFRTH